MDASRFATFQAAAKGLTAYQCAVVLLRIRRLIDYRGCTKQELAEAFVEDGIFEDVTGDQLRQVIASRYGATR